MTILQKIQKLTWWNEIAKLKDILIDFNSAKESIDLRVTAIEDAPAPSGDFIPLTGTTPSNPVSGEIEVLETEKGIWSKGGSYPDDYSGIFLGEGSSGLYFRNLFDNNEVSIRTYDSGVVISDNRLTAIGLTGLQDFSTNITALDYTQKIYVDERGSIVNTTTSVLSASDLSTTYPNAKDGFSVICPNIVGGGKYYIKAGASWYYQQILLVV